MVGGLEEAEKYSTSGKYQIENIVGAAELSDRQKALAEFGKQLGVGVIFFKGDKKLHGAYSNGLTYINVEGETSHEWAFWHESFHWLAANNPELLNEVAAAVGLTDKQLADYRREIGRENLSEAETVEEMLADNMKDTAGRAGLLKEIGKKNKPLIERLISWLKSVMEKFTDFFNTPRNGLTREQKNKMYEAFGKMARTIEDGKGNAIFRFNNRTKEIELANGEALPQVKFSMRDTTVADSLVIPKKYEIAKGYYTESGRSLRQSKSDEFIVDKNQRSDLGKITEEVEEKSQGKIKSLPVRLKVGFHSFDTKNGHGYKHIAAKHLTKIKAHGFDNALDFVKYTLDNFDKAFKPSGHPNRIILYCSDESRGFMPIQLVDEGDYYNVITAYPNENNSVNANGELVFDRSKTPPAVTTDSNTNTTEKISAGKTDNTGGVNLSGANVLTNSPSENIPQSGGDSNIKYSVNNGETLIQKIRSKLPDWIGKPTDLNERRRKFITRKLQELTGYKVAYGHLTGNDGVFIDDLQKVIRSRRAYDWENLLPKVGAVISKQLNLPQTEQMSNYISSWILDGETNASAEAKEFEKAMRANPAIFEILREIQNSFQEINEMTPIERTKEKIRGELPKKSLLSQSIGDKLYEELVDDLNPIRKLVAQVEEQYGRKIADIVNPYVQARLFKGSTGISLNNMVDGEKVEEVQAAMRKIFPRVNFDTFKPLAVILNEAGGRAAFKDFEAYCVACGTKDLYEANRQAGEEIYDTMMSEEDCDAIIRDYSKKFGRSQQDLVNFSRITLEILCDSGVISQRARDSMFKRWKNYVPMHRVFDENEELNFGDSMKRRKGSNRDLISPIQTIIRNTHEMVKRAERNKVKRSIAGLARMGGFGEYVEEVSGKNPSDKTIITFFEDGAKKYLQTDAAVVEAVNNLQTVTQGNLFTRILTAATGVLRSIYTAINPDFAAGNIFRDVPDAYIHNQHGEISPLQMILASWRGLMSALHKDATFYEWMAMGGAQSTLVSPDRNYTQNSVDSLTKTRRERWLGSGVGGFFSQVLNGLQAISEYSEYATRIGVYTQAKKILSAKNADGKATLEDMRKAALASRDSTIDFARAGTSMRTMNKYVAFSNAAVQGFDRTLRTFNPRKLRYFGGTKESEQELFGAIVRLAISGVLPAIACFALNHDEDWWRNLPAWQKENNWIIGDGVKIPKGMDIGLRLASTLTEEFLNWAANNRPADLSRILPRKNDVVSKFVPTVLLPIFETSINYSLFMDKPIVPVREQNLPDYMQRDSFSSGFAKYIGEATGFSPRKIDHLISGYLGFLGKFALQGYDMTLGDKQFNLAAENLPMVRRLTFEPYRNPQIVQDYYDKSAEQEKFYNEYRATKKKPAGFDVALYQRLKNNRKAMQALSRRERALNNDIKITPDERKQKLRELEKMRIKICERVLVRNGGN